MFTNVKTTVVYSKINSYLQSTYLKDRSYQLQVTLGIAPPWRIYTIQLQHLK